MAMLNNQMVYTATPWQKPKDPKGYALPGKQMTAKKACVTFYVT